MAIGVILVLILAISIFVVFYFSIRLAQTQLLAQIKLIVELPNVISFLFQSLFLSTFISLIFALLTSSLLQRDWIFPVVCFITFLASCFVFFNNFQFCYFSENQLSLITFQFLKHQKTQFDWQQIEALIVLSNDRISEIVLAKNTKKLVVHLLVDGHKKALFLEKEIYDFEMITTIFKSKNKPVYKKLFYEKSSYRI